MKIIIKDTTPNATKLMMAKIEDLYGSVLVVRGWL